MDTVTLGRTGLQTSAVGLGCGGPSRLGQAYGRTKEQAADVVRAAVDLGITFVDTAEAYGTEPAVGLALGSGLRDKVVLCTKATTRVAEGKRTPAQIEEACAASLKNLQTDVIDVYLFHGIPASAYDYVKDELYPAAVKLREQGKIRYIGISEVWNRDPGHEMLQTAVHDGIWDVMMVGFNLLNPSARQRVFPQTQANDIGTLIMFAVRRALSDPDRLREVLAELKGSGQVPDDLDEHALDFLTEGGVSGSVTEAGYRFCRHEPGCDVILTGTGNIDHLRENVESLTRPRLPDEHLARLDALFGRVDTVTAQ